MNEITLILNAADCGDTLAAEHLLLLAYARLRKLAESRMAAESGAQTLQATALVHEAYLKLAGPDGKGRNFASAEDCFAAADQAMRRILIDNARRKTTPMHGGISSAPSSKAAFQVLTNPPKRCWRSMRPWSNSKQKMPTSPAS